MYNNKVNVVLVLYNVEYVVCNQLEHMCCLLGILGYELKMYGRYIIVLIYFVKDEC